MARRGAGEGSIRKRVRCRCGRISYPPATACPGCGAVLAGQPVGWEARYSWTDEGGGRRQGSIYARTRQEAATKLAEVVQRVSRGQRPSTGLEPIGDFLSRWLASVEPRLRPRTLDTYRSIVEHHLVPTLGRVRLRDLGVTDVNGFVAAALKAGRHPRSVAHWRAVLRTAIADAERWGLVTRNVVELSDPPRLAAPEPALIDPVEARAMLAAVTGTDLEGPVAVALWAGLRLGEVLGLRWADVDLDARVIAVRRALQRRGGISRLVEPKSRTSRRTVPMPQPLADVLTHLRPAQFVADGLVFNVGGDPIEPTGLSHRFTNALRRAGLRPRRFHDLRHAHAGLLLLSGADIKVVSAALGHASISLTSSTYAGVLPALKREAADGLARLLGEHA